MKANEILEKCKAMGVVPTMVIRHPEKGVTTVDTYDPRVAKVVAMMEWGLKVEDMAEMTVSIKNTPVAEM